MSLLSAVKERFKKKKKNMRKMYVQREEKGTNLERDSGTE